MKKNLLGIAMILLAASTNVFSQNWLTSGNNSTKTDTIGSKTNFDVGFITNNALRMTISKNGKVGIGVKSPASTLHVQKSALTDLLIRSTGGDANLVIDRPGNGMEAVTKYTQTGVPQWKTGLMVNATGSPDYVIKNEISNTDALTITGNSNNYVNINSGNLTLNSTSYLFNTVNDLNIHAYGPPTFSTYTAGNIFLAYPGSFKKSGNVAIGSDDASKAKLSVQGTVGNTIAMFKRNSTSKGVSIIGDWPGVYFNSYFNSTTKAMAPGYCGAINFDPSNGILTLNTSATSAVNADDAMSIPEAVHIMPNGSVGIGILGVSAALDVKILPGVTATASFWGTNSAWGTHFCHGPNENTYIRGGLSTSNVIIGDVNNGVAIGGAQVANGYKLSVNGKVICSELRVAAQGSWPDFVFKKDYKLTSISDLKKSIEANGHLPGIPSASEVESNGIAVGEMQTKMVQKIEELTLYIIDLQQQLNALKSSK